MTTTRSWVDGQQQKWIKKSLSWDTKKTTTAFSLLPVFSENTEQDNDVLRTTDLYKLELYSARGKQRHARTPAGIPQLHCLPLSENWRHRLGCSFVYSLYNRVKDWRLANQLTYEASVGPRLIKAILSMLMPAALALWVIDIHKKYCRAQKVSWHIPHRLERMTFLRIVLLDKWTKGLGGGKLRSKQGIFLVL